MPSWLSTILQIILFIFCLSTLVLVHEAGHLAAAKAFGVYCDDFSIGFGKAIIHKKRKNGETYFSFRVVPFGGYVSMAGDEGEIKEGLTIEKKRTLEGINKGKAAVIMAAGIIMNVILSILLFYIYNQCFPTVNVPYINAFISEEGSISEQAGITTYDPETDEGDFSSIYIDPRYPSSGEQVWYYSLNSIAYYNDGSSEEIAVAILQSEATINDLSLDSLFNYYRLFDYELTYSSDDDDTEFTYTRQLANFAELITYETENLSYIELHLPMYSNSEGSYYCSYCHTNFTSEDIESGVLSTYYDEVNDSTYYKHTDCEWGQGHDELIEYGSVSINCIGEDKVMTIYVEDDGFSEIGLSLYSSSYYQSFGEAWTNAFVQFGEGSGLIFRTIGGLFVGEGWENLGSIVSIYTSTSSILTNYGVSYFIYYWGLISVNLAIFNLLPFPGLDGWQLVVIAIEGISRKKVPDKAKTIMSYIGLALLFGLMIVLIVKDIMGLF